ncbi:MAG TPA: GntR family transcriptional regulator [Galbitalea sp.]|jgi:DNA-binding GntR family transcriptional regulator
MSADPSLHERLRQAILTLALAPGERLSERGLEPEFGASRTPIRAALMRLQSDGLVRRDDRGWLVAPIDLEEVASIYEYREIIEGATARLAVDRASRDDLTVLATLAASTDAAETPEHSIDSGTSFHVGFARLSGNAFIIDAMEGALTRLYRTRWLEVQDAASRDRVHREHGEIAAALLAGDADAAELATLEHLRGTGARLVNSLAASRQQLRATGILLS